MTYYVDIYENQHFRLNGKSYSWSGSVYHEFDLLPHVEEWLNLNCTNTWSVSSSAILSTKTWATVYFTCEDAAIHFKLMWF